MHTTQFRCQWLRLSPYYINVLNFSTCLFTPELMIVWPRERWSWARPQAWPWLPPAWPLQAILTPSAVLSILSCLILLGGNLFGAELPIVLWWFDAVHSVGFPLVWGLLLWAERQYAAMGRIVLLALHASSHPHATASLVPGCAFRWKQMRGLSWQRVWRQRVQRTDRRLRATRKCGFLCKICETPHCIKLCLHRCKKQLYKLTWEKNTWKTIKYKDPIYDWEVFLSHKSLEVGRVFGGSIPVWSVFKYFFGILYWRRDAGLKGPVPWLGVIFNSGWFCSPLHCEAKEVFLKAEGRRSVGRLRGEAKTTAFGWLWLLTFP